MKIKKAFTLIEILVVVTIIGLITSIAVVSYTSINKNSRDARRKADLEQIRAALEMYRSNNNTYPTALDILITPPVYIQSVPKDPKDPAFSYYYIGSASDYTLASQLEGTSICVSAPGTNSCGANNPCNYCLGPYGQK